MTSESDHSAHRSDVFPCAGLLCNTFAPRAVDAVRPVLPVLSLVDTCCCVGASLTGAAATRSPIAAQVLLPVRVPCQIWTFLIRI